MMRVLLARLSHVALLGGHHIARSPAKPRLLVAHGTDVNALQKSSIGGGGGEWVKTLLHNLFR